FFDQIIAESVDKTGITPGWARSPVQAVASAEIDAMDNVSPGPQTIGKTWKKWGARALQEQK
ncbi:MAG TPA: hypothetical protein PLF25_09385, partial [Accumulibacter sp.]|nr:hypothetical protein [Accumulibacter sp.]